MIGEWFIGQRVNHRVDLPHIQGTVIGLEPENRVAFVKWDEKPDPINTPYSWDILASEDRLEYV